MHHSSRRWIALLALSGGCAAGDAANLGDGYTEYSPSLAVGLPGGDTGNTTLVNTPEFFAISGSVAVTRGDLDPSASTLDMDFRNADGESICTWIRPVLSATTEVSSDPDLPLYGWWSIALDTDAPPSCAFGPDTMSLGIGAWDLHLDAAATSQNLVGDDLYGLYLQTAPASTVYVFGASGTADQFSGATPPVDVGPLPDGVYQLRTLYLLPVQP